MARKLALAGMFCLVLGVGLVIREYLSVLRENAVVDRLSPPPPSSTYDSTVTFDVRSMWSESYALSGGLGLVLLGTCLIGGSLVYKLALRLRAT